MSSVGHAIGAAAFILALFPGPASSESRDVAQATQVRGDVPSKLRCRMYFGCHPVDAPAWRADGKVHRDLPQ